VINLQPTLENELLRLRPLMESDYEELYQCASDPLIWELHPNKNRYKREVFEVYFQEAIEGKMAFAVIDLKTNKIIGSTRFYDFKPEQKSIAIGYTFLTRNYWGGLYNKSMKGLLTDFAFQYFDEIILHIGANNFRSQKATEKLGAVKIAEELIPFPGDANALNFVYQLKK
jgi:RimJ/RimL family protein N-acetyltransferase